MKKFFSPSFGNTLALSMIGSTHAKRILSVVAGLSSLSLSLYTHLTLPTKRIV